MKNVTDKSKALELVPAPPVAAATTIPTLPQGNDAEVASQLRALIKDASDGLKRVIVAGLFIERVATELKHGQLMTWVESHCPDVSWRTVCRWRELARGVMDTVGIKSDTMSLLTIPMHEVLRLPASELPAEAASIRTKIDDLLEGKTAKQLFLNFAQTEDGEKPKVGRVVGSSAKPGKVDPEEQLKLARENAKTRLGGIRGDLLTLLANEDPTLGYIALDGLKEFSGVLIDLQKRVKDLIKAKGKTKKDKGTGKKTKAKMQPRAGETGKQFADRLASDIKPATK